MHDSIHMDLAVIVCGRHGLAVIVLRVAVMDLFWGHYRLWPSWIWPSLFVAVMDLAVIVFHVAVMVCGRHSRSPRVRWAPRSIIDDVG